jgi:hypothetical protein
MKSAVLSTFMWGLFLLGAHENNGLQVINADYFVYNELTDTTTSKIGYSLDQSDGLLAYSQENRATVSDDNLYETGVQWHEYKVQDAFPDSGDADVISRIHYPYVLLGSKAGVSLLKYTSRTFSGASDVSFSSFSNFEADAFAMSTRFFAVSGKLMAGTSIWGRRLLIFELDSADGSWKIGFNHSITGDKYAASLATLSDTMLAYGVTSEKIVLLKKTSPSFNAGWSIAATILSPTGLDTGTSGIGGFGAVLDYSDGILVVGGPSVNVDTLTGSHHGKVFVYNITNFNDPRGPFTLEPDSKLADFADHSETGSSVGIQFGESFFVSKRLTSVATESIMLGVGAPGANGVAIYYLEKDMSGRRLFNVVNMVFVQGFRLKLDHDTGDAVSWDAIGERMFLGAPLADNFDIYGSQQQYGVIGRLYVSTVCPPNKYRHSPSVYSYVKVCKLCSVGKFSTGLHSSSCSSCTTSTKPNNADWLGEGKGCQWACKPNFFGPSCVTCADFHLPENPPPAGATWESVGGVCQFMCSSDFMLNSDGTGCSPKPAPENVSIIDVTWSSVVLTFSHYNTLCPTFSVQIFADDNERPVNRTGMQPSCSETVVKIYIVRLEASKTYRFRVREGTAGLLSVPTASILTLPPVPPTPPTFISVTSKIGGVLSLIWDLPNDTGGSSITNYTLRVCKSNADLLSCSFTHTSSPLREASVRGLRAHGLYFYSVAAYAEKSHARGNYSTWVSTVMGAPLKPGKPVPPHIVSATCSSMNISLSALSFETDGGESPSKYRVMVLSKELGSRTLVRMTDTEPVPILKITKLSSGSTYAFAVAAINSAGVSIFSLDSTSGLTVAPPCLPEPPHRPNISHVEPDSIKACLTRPRNDGGAMIKNYSIFVDRLFEGRSIEVRRITINAEDSLALRESTSSVICTDVGRLNGSTKYAFRARATTLAGVSPLSLSSPSRTTLSPILPRWDSTDSLFQLACNQGGTLKFRWPILKSNGGAPVLDYKIYWREKNETKWHRNQFSFEAATMEGRVYGLRANTLYSVRLVAINVVGESNPGVLGLFSTGNASVADPPQGISTLAIGSSTLQFTWSAVSLSGRGGSNINGFYAYLSSADDSARNRSSPLLTAPPARFTHLHGGHQYLLYMLTVSNNMKLLGPISAPVIFTTTAPRTPVVPTSVECDTSRVTASSLRLSWPVSIDNGGRPITNVIVYSVKFWDIHGNRVVKKVPSFDLSGVTETSAVVHGLYADSNYSFFIQVFNEIGGSENSTESNTVLTSSQSHPSPPRTLKVSKRTGGSISFVDLLSQNLGGASRANSFVLIKYSAVMSGGEGVGSTGPPTYVATKKGQDSFELVGLSPLTTYHFLATTVAEGGLVEAMIRFSDQPGQFLSALSASFINGTTTASVPGRSPAVVVLEISHHSFRVSIRPPEDTGGLPLTSRTLSISSKGRVLGQIEDIPPILNEQTLTLHGLLGNTKYCVTLLSANEIGISSSTSEPVIIETPDANLPSLPQNVRIARRSEGGLKITWLSPESNGGASITHYGLSLKVSPQESDWTNISVPSLPLEYKNDTFVRLPVVKHSYHWDTALSDGFNFVASVRAVSRISSTSDTSNVSSVTFHFSSSTSALMKPASIACSHSLDSHSATCTWTGSLDARETGYDITLRLGSLVVFTGETVAGSTLSITFDRLRANSSYTMQVFSTKKLNSESSEYPAEVTFVTALKAIPSSPLNFQLLDMLSSAVSFGWSDPASWGGGSHLRFLIECSTHGNSAGLWTSVSTYDLGFDEVEKSTSLRAGPSNYTMKVANLLNNTQYFFRITAQNEIGDSTQKLTSSGLTTLSTTADNCLTGIRPVAVDFGSVSFIWNTPLVAFSHSNILYRVHCDGSDGSHHVKVAAQNFTVVNNLMPQTFYSCRVVLVLNGVSGTCNRWTSPIMTRVETVPDQIATVNISAVIRSSYLVTHFVPPPMVNNLQNMFYRVKLFECHDDRMTVCRSAPCSDPTTSFIFDANFTSPDANILVTLEVPGILAKKIYRVSVAARNYIPQYGLDSGCSEPFEIGHGEVPSRPQSLLVEEIRNSSVQLSWSPPKYIGGGDNVIYLFECWKPSHPSAGYRHGECIQCTGYRVISLLGSSQYTCRVYAKTAFGMSPNSNAVIFNTGRPTKPGKPESAPSIADVKRPDAFSLSWNLDNIDSGGSPIQLFHIYLGVGDAEEHSALILTANTSSSQCTITGLSANTSYVTMFSGVNSLGEGPLSDAAVVTTTRATTPSSASNIEVAVRSNDEGMYELKWDHASMTGGLPVSYKIFRSSYSKFSPCDSDGIAGSFPHNSQNLWKNGMICPSRSNTLCNSRIISTVAYELESSLEFVGETPSNSFGPTAISEGRMVLFVLASMNMIGMSETNSSVIFLAPISSPSQPLNLSYEHDTVSGEKLKWGFPISDGGCRVGRYTVEQSSRRKIGDAWSVPQYFSIYNTTNLELTSNCFEMYKWRVRAENDAGVSLWTDDIVSPEPGFPRPPTSMSAMAPTDRTMQLQWSAAPTLTCPVLRFYVEQSKQSEIDGSWNNDVQHFSTTLPRLNVQGLQCYSRYRWRVQTETLVGNSSWSTDIIANTSVGPPSEVCAVRIETLTPVSVTLSWDRPCSTCGNDVVQYEVRVRLKTDTETNWLPLGEGTDASGSMALTKQLYTFSGLDMDEEYIFGVRAKSSSGAGIWQYVNARTSARVPCPNGTPKALCDRGTKLSIPCSCHGICHAWDGTCSCDGGWKGANCNIPDGVHMTLYLKGPNVDNEWSDYEKTRFCEALAKAANIDANRVPMEYVVMHVEHSRMRRLLNTRVSKVSFVILNPLQKSGAILNEPRASKVQESIEKSILEGEFSAFAILSFVSSDGKQMSAPALPKCSYVDADSCVPCVAQRGCGWCDTGPKWCSQGDANGPAFLLSVSCPASNWRYATSEKCAPTSVAICSAHASCSPCLKEAAASCGWCAETATCIPRSKEKNMCSNWGFTDAVCVGTCTKQKFETDMTGFIWMGDDHRGSELFYQANKHCKWHVGPGQDPDPTKYVEVGKVNFVLDRADIGRGDRLTVYDGKSQSSDGILIDINGNSMTESSFPIDVTVDSSLIIVEFSSDMSPQTVGTGFLATYKGHPRSFWDSYILLSLSSVIMLALCCCLCYKCSVLPNDMEGRQVENSFGLDLEATANGASLENIKKFPTFVFSDEHKMKMEKLEQELACSICLGDYENEEELRLLPCGHMFHTPCIDAWLQINRICPLCKADVYVLAEQRRRGKKKDKRKKFMDKVLRRRRIDVSPMNPGGGRGFTERQEELLTIPGSKTATKGKTGTSSGGDFGRVSATNRVQPVHPSSVAGMSSEISRPGNILHQPINVPPLRFPGRNNRRDISGWSSSDDEGDDGTVFHDRYQSRARRRDIEMTAVPGRGLSRPSRPRAPPIRANEDSTEGNLRSLSYDDEGNTASDLSNNMRRRGRGSVLV